MRGEILSCGHESMLPKALLYDTFTAWCPTCTRWQPRVPVEARSGKCAPLPDGSERAS